MALQKTIQPFSYRRQGFTIVELLIVIVVIGVLAAISIVAYNGIQSRSHSTAIKSDLANNAKKLEEYKIVHDKYPQTVGEFREANLDFTLSSSRFVIYCVQNHGSSPNWALIHRSTALDKDFYRTGIQSTKPYTGNWSTALDSCNSIGVGGVTGDGSVGRWLRALGDWGDWVVY